MSAAREALPQVDIYIVIEGGCLRAVYGNYPAKIAVDLLDLDNDPDLEEDVNKLAEGEWGVHQVW